MKKLIIPLWFILILVVVIGCKPSTTSTNNQAAAQQATPLTRYTLNGYTYSQANTMVQAFLKDQTIYDSRTSVYLNSTVFNNMVSLLNSDGADGFRLYFSKTTSGQNTIVIVSTFDGGPGLNSGDPEIHRDYFQYTTPYPAGSNIGDVNGIAMYDTDNGGATLFTNPNCPAKDDCGYTAHYITCKQAQGMVTSFVGKSKNDDINGYSEWFDIGILNDLNSLLKSTPNSGLRIYFATRTDAEQDGNGEYPDGYVIILTQLINNIRTDQYVCLPIKPKYSYPITGGGGGTDNGEECPNNCDGTSWP